MNSVTRTSVFSRSRSSRRRSSCTSRNVGPSSRRWTPFLPTGALSVARVREMFWATASWSTCDFFPFLRFLPFSRRRSSSGGAPGAADATGRGGTDVPGPDGAPRATGRGRTGVGINGFEGGAEAGGGGPCGRGATATLGAGLGGRDRLRCNLHGLRGPTPFGRRRGLLLLALVTLPTRAHQRHLLVLERRQMTAHEDVHLFEHAHQL